MILVVFVLMTGSIATAQRQTRPQIPETGPFWVGGSFANSLRFGGGTFGFGLTPMAGYVFAPNFSVGPFVRLDYYYERFLIGPGRYARFSSFNTGPGIFARADIARMFFAQIEYEHAFLQRAEQDAFGNIFIDNNGKVVKESLQQDFVYIGAGYSSGGYVQVGISIHYNILDDALSERFPWDYRFSVRVPINSTKK